MQEMRAWSCVAFVVAFSASLTGLSGDAFAQTDERLWWSKDTKNLIGNNILYQGCTSIPSMVPYEGGVLIAGMNYACDSNKHNLSWMQGDKNPADGNFDVSMEAHTKRIHQLYNGCTYLPSIVPYEGGVLLAGMKHACDANRHNLSWMQGDKNPADGNFDASMEAHNKRIHELYNGCTYITAMAPYEGGVLIASMKYACDSNKHNLIWMEGDGNATDGVFDASKEAYEKRLHLLYVGCTYITAMVPFDGGVLIAADKYACERNQSNIVWLKGDNDPTNGLSAVDEATYSQLMKEVYRGTTLMRSMVPYEGGLLIAGQVRPGIYCVHLYRKGTTSVEHCVEDVEAFSEAEAKSSGKVAAAKKHYERQVEISLDIGAAFSGKCNCN